MVKMQEQNAIIGMLVAVALALFVYWFFGRKKKQD